MPLGNSPPMPGRTPPERGPPRCDCAEGCAVPSGPPALGSSRQLIVLRSFDDPLAHRLPLGWSDRSQAHGHSRHDVQTTCAVAVVVGDLQYRTQLRLAGSEELHRQDASIPSGEAEAAPRADQVLTRLCSIELRRLPGGRGVATHTPLIPDRLNVAAVRELTA